MNLKYFEKRKLLDGMDAIMAMAQQCPPGVSLYVHVNCIGGIKMTRVFDGEEGPVAHLILSKCRTYPEIRREIEKQL